MDRVFKALADPSRRLLLDLLRKRDGRTLSELAAALPDMTRFGVSSHLNVLAAADLVSTVKVGREKRHHLNAVPLREIQNRWLTPFTAGRAQALLDLRTRLEQETDMTVDVQTAPDTVFVIWIRATAERVWDALTDTTDPRPWLYDTVTTSDWTPGAPYTQKAGDVPLIRGEVVEAERPHRLVLTFDPCWDDEVAVEPAGRLEYRVEPADGVVKLTVLLTGLTGESARSAARDTAEIYSALKTWIETGQPLRA